MTGCPYTYIYSNSTTNSCSRSNERNQCYCNLIGSNCYENKSDVCASSSQPLSQPSSQPTRQPSSQPSSHPTRQPTRQPSSQPTRQPSSQHLCKCNDVECGQCMTGCSYIYSSLQLNECPKDKRRNNCYCNMMGINCNENEYEVCGLLPTSQPTRQPSMETTIYNYYDILMYLFVITIFISSIYIPDLVRQVISGTCCIPMEAYFTIWLISLLIMGSVVSSIWADSNDNHDIKHLTTGLFLYLLYIGLYGSISTLYILGYISKEVEVGICFVNIIVNLANDKDFF